MKQAERQHECALTLNDITYMIRVLAQRDPFMTTFKTKTRREKLAEMQRDLAKWVAELQEDA